MTYVATGIINVIIKDKNYLTSFVKNDFQSLPLGGAGRGLYFLWPTATFFIVRLYSGRCAQNLTKNQKIIHIVKAVERKDV